MIDGERIALVTGVTGQDGTYLAELLAAQGWEIHGVVRQAEDPPTSLLSLGDQVILHEADLREPGMALTLMKEVRPSGIFNLVGVSSVAASWEDPGAALDVNAGVVARLLDALVRCGRGSARLVQASSGEIFAGAGIVPQDERTPIAPLNPYGVSKAAAHALIQQYRQRGVFASNAILYNHESPRRPESFLSRRVCLGVASIVRGEAGSLTLGNLDARRDWGWAPDYVDGLLRIAQAGEPDDFVLGTGESHSVREFVAAAFAVVGLEWRNYVEVDPAHLRQGDAPVLVGSPAHAWRVLGWRPTVTFGDLVERLVDAALER